MRTQIYSAVMALTFISSIPAALAVTFIGPVAYAAEPASAVCQQALRPATTGGAIREQLEARAKCTPSQSSTPDAETSIQPLANPPTNTKTIDTNQSTSRVNDSNLVSCLSLPSWLKPEDWEFRERAYLCKYGS